MKISKRGIFNLIVSFLPPALAAPISAAETVLTSGADKKAKVLSVATNALIALNAVHPNLVNDPRFQLAMGKVNDAIVEAAKVAEQLAQAAVDKDPSVAPIPEGEAPVDASLLEPEA